MTFAALLTKELRLRLRRERTIWVLITYLLVMTLLGFLFISRTSAYNSNSVSTLGLGLYTLLVFVQLFLIMFITPAFTATSINGEKERQTFDLLLCSRLSAFELVAGKLVAPRPYHSSAWFSFSEEWDRRKSFRRRWFLWSPPLWWVHSAFSAQRF